MESFIFYKNQRIHYNDKGEGNAILFIHGFTESLKIWDFFSEELSKNFRVICVDLPGHGQSEYISPVHTMDLMADCVKKVLDKLKVKEVLLIGHSMGGYVSLAFTEMYPSMIKGLGLFHSTAYADTPETLKNRMRTNNYVKNNHFNFLCEFIPSLFAVKSKQKLKKEISELVEESKKISPESVIAANSGMAERPDRTHILKNADFPVLFIAGKQDSRILFEKVIEQIAMPNDCTSLLLGDIAHMGYLEAKEKTFFTVKTFCEWCYK